MAQYAGVCRLVWNLALDQRLNHHRQYRRTTGRSLTWVAQSRELTALRGEVDFIREIPQSCLERVIVNLGSAFERAWKGSASFPQFKRKGVDEAFSFKARDSGMRRLNAKWSVVRIPKLGWVKFRRTRDIEGDIREVTFTQTALGWQVSIGCMVDREVADPGGAIGIDRGVAVPLALSDGQTFVMPPALAVLERRARKAQRVVSRRQRGSQRYAAAKRRAARLKARQARIRTHWAHEATTTISRQYGTVVIEALRTKNMTAAGRGKRGLNRVILNVGWHQIERMLSYKAARLVKVDPRHTSQACSSCGTVDPENRKSQAVFQCIGCGHTDNADRNAAINILNRGNTPGVEAPGCRADEARTLVAA